MPVKWNKFYSSFSNGSSPEHELLNILSKCEARFLCAIHAQAQNMITDEREPSTNFDSQYYSEDCQHIHSFQDNGFQHTHATTATGVEAVTVTGQSCRKCDYNHIDWRVEVYPYQGHASLYGNYEEQSPPPTEVFTGHEQSEIYPDILTAQLDYDLSSGETTIIGQSYPDRQPNGFDGYDMSPPYTDLGEASPADSDPADNGGIEGFSIGIKCGKNCVGDFVGEHRCLRSGPNTLTIHCRGGNSCRSTFRTRGLFNRHYSSCHNRAMLFCCPVVGCPRVGTDGFTRRDNWLQHRRKVHGEELVKVKVRLTGRIKSGAYGRASQTAIGGSQYTSVTRGCSRE